ncbi:MAG TPA: DJ-1/PfpI family protein [Symbiobacteriaceae bacterium]|jgi:transcriptional regulator GlxA family with amidase domain|nr:DJ-1/PfpI family protein [Symbiobacteriaceae bacterium]
MLKVAVVLFDGVEELDFAGPLEVLGQAGDVFTVGPAREVRGRHGLTVRPDFTFADAPRPDVLVVPGGPVTREDPASLFETVAYVRRVAPFARKVLSVCTGAFILAMAGQLHQRTVTTHFQRRRLLADNFPDVHVAYRRVVMDGKFISTAGVSAGLDGALHLLFRLKGLEVARRVANQIEYPWHVDEVMDAEPYTFWEEGQRAIGW